ncbi:MAG: hypothetical protein WBP85_01500 [Terracidiphilus sp.]
MNRFIGKLTTKPYWWWERKRSYPIRSRYDRLPPLPVKQGTRRFVVLTTPDTMSDALWAAWSWYRYLRDEDCSLQITVDGVISEDQREAASRLFPGILIDSAQWACEYVCARVPGIQYFVDSYPTGRKLALILALADREPLIYCDCDVLAFKRPDELFALMNRNFPAYFAEDVDGTRDMQVAVRAEQLGLNYIPSFNSGFLYVPKGALSIRLAGQILATWRAPGESWYAEQTVLSFMLRQLHAEPLPPSHYVVNIRRQFYWEPDVDYASIVARHFTGPVRHVMYKYGMPILLDQSKELLMSVPSASYENA